MLGRRAAIVALIVGATILLSGCGGGDDEPPALDIDSIVDTTSDFQKNLIEDGEVSPSEYEDALIAYRTCVEDAGATPSEIYETGNNEKAFSYEVIAPNEKEVGRINAAADDCMFEYYSDVGKVWAYQQLLSPDELDDLRPKVAECLRDAGLDVDDDVTLEDVVERVNEIDDQSVIQPCVEKYPGFFSVAPDPSNTHDESTDGDEG